MNVRSCATVTAIAVAIFGCGYAANSLRDAAANQMQPRAEAVKYFTNTSRVRLSNDTFVNITECHTPHRQTKNTIIECKYSENP